MPKNLYFSSKFSLVLTINISQKITTEMGQYLQTLIALSEKPGSEHIADNKHLELQFQGNELLLLISMGSGYANGGHLCIQAKHSHKVK